jgi:hypothetical protein
MTTRPHTADDALRILADPRSTQLRRPLIDALFRVGIGDHASATGRGCAHHYTQIKKVVTRAYGWHLIKAGLTQAVIDRLQLWEA